MRVLVCGGRDYADAQRVEQELVALGPTEIAQGGARGADALAHAWAKARGVPVATYLPDWRSFGASAGPLRNQRMLDEFRPDLVLAFHGGRGTADMVGRARRAGIEVRLVT